MQTHTEKRKEKPTRICRAAERRANRPLHIEPSQAYWVDEASAALGVSRAMFYKMVAAGEITVIKRGGRTVTPGSEIIRLNSVSGEAA